MFDGKSKTRYVGTGKQKDTSKAKLLSDARAQREKRALEKKRNTAALSFQTLWRRHAACVQSTQKVRETLGAQLATIAKISALMPFNIPLDTLYTLMRCSVFIFGARGCRTPGDAKAYEAVLSLVLKSCTHTNPLFCLFNMDNISNADQRQRWQVLVSSYVTMATSYIGASSSNSSNEKSAKYDPNSVIGDSLCAETAALVHHFAAFVAAADGSSMQQAMRLGTSRAVSLSLCSVLRDLCDLMESTAIVDQQNRQLLDSLTKDIARTLRFGLSSTEGDGKGSSKSSPTTGVLGTRVEGQKNLWHVFTTELLGVPRVWGHPSLSPLLEMVLGLSSNNDSGDSANNQVEDGVKEKQEGQSSGVVLESRTMTVWHNILFSATTSFSCVTPSSSENRRPFAVLSGMLGGGGGRGEEIKDEDAETHGPSFLLVNNFFDYALHRDPSLLAYSPRSTHYWIDMLSRALNRRDVPLTAAINRYHGLADLEPGQMKMSGQGLADDEGEKDDDDDDGGRGSAASVGTRDVINTILEDTVAQTRSRLVHRSGRAAEAAAVDQRTRGLSQQHGSQRQESKRPRLLANTSLSSTSGAGRTGVTQGPTVADTMELLTYLCTPVVLSAMAEHCSVCLASTQADSDGKEGIAPALSTGNTSASSRSHDLDELLQLLAVLLTHSPAGTAFSGQHTTQASIASQILNVFAFGHTSHQLVTGLWRRVHAYVQTHPGDHIQQFVLENSSPLAMTKVAPRSAFSPLPAATATVTKAGGDVTNNENASLLVLLCVLSHQLLAIDDEEFVGGGKALNMTDVCELVGVLKALMCEMYWTSPLLTTHENAFADDGVDEASAADVREKELTFLRIHLSNVQLLYISTKVFNQLSVRNERIHFLPPSGWLWSSLSGNAELELLDVDANPFLEQRKTRARMVLLLCPQVISFNQRAVYFQRLIQNDKKKIRNPMHHISHHQRSMIRVNIHRAALFDSTFAALSQLTAADWKKDIKVVFINEQGVEESGIDGGGLFKEFIDVLLKDMFSPRALPPLHLRRASSGGGNGSDFIDLTEKEGVSGIDSGLTVTEMTEMVEDDKEYRELFLTTATGLLVPNPSILLGPQSKSHVRTPLGTLEQYRFMGKMLGKAVYEEILVEPQFAGMFLNHLLGRLNFIDDLVTLDQEIYQSLLKLKRDYLHGEGNIEDLELMFEVDLAVPGGHTVSRELMPGGSSIPVTKENLVSYLYLYANFKLNIETYRQSVAFLQGFRELIPTEWMRMFNTSELQLVIGGDNEKGIDLPSLQRLCTYSGGYHPSQPYIKAFWEILESLSPADQGEFLRFVTSCSRPPLLGYGQFDPPFNIMKISLEGGGEAGSSRLPMAASCFNQFKLPQYDTVEELREKFLYSIQSKAGFELS